MSSHEDRDYYKEKERKRRIRSSSRSRDRDRGREREKERDRERIRSRSRSRSRSRDRRNTNKISENERRSTIRKERKSRWSDAPLSPTSESRLKESNFSNIPNSIENLPSNDILSINEKLKQINPLLALTSQTESNLNPNIIYTLNDNSKIKKKVYIPKVPGVNFVGLLIGPKGTYQKRLETQSNCKILIRGKGTQKEGLPPQLDDDEDQHVLIVGDTEVNVNKAQYLIEKVLFSDLDTRNKIKEEQLKASQEIRSESFFDGGLPPQIEDHLMTPYGPPDKSARIIPVPNDCVGLIIGKNGDTIRRLHRETGCKIQIAKAEIPNTEVRNVFIEGPPEKYEFARKSIEEIVAEQQKLKANMANIAEKNPFPGPYTYHKVPNRHVGLIIGKNGETLKSLHQKTNCFIYIPNDYKPGDEFRNIELSGNPQAVEECKKEIDLLISNVMNMTQESLNIIPDPYLAANMIYPPYPPFNPYGINYFNYNIPKAEGDNSALRPSLIPGQISPLQPNLVQNINFGNIMQNPNPQNKININLINSNNFNLPPGAQIHPYPMGMAGHMGFPPNFIPQYMPPLAPYTNLGVGMVNGAMVPSIVNPQLGASPGVSDDNKNNFENKTDDIKSIEKESNVKEDKSDDNKNSEEKDKDKPKNSMLSYIYGGQL